VFVWTREREGWRGREGGEGERERECEKIVNVQAKSKQHVLGNGCAVSARWFGVPNVTLAHIQVSASCQEITVSGGRSVKIYNGQALNGCTVRNEHPLLKEIACMLHTGSHGDAHS
jgi:hypothetical protein